MYRRGSINDVNKWLDEELQTTFDINGLPKFTPKSGWLFCIRCGTYIGKIKHGRYIGDPNVKLRLLCNECRKITVNSILSQVKNDKNT